MFRNHFDSAQWKAFMVLVYKVALADHRVPLPEGLFVDELMSEAEFEEPMSGMDILGETDLEPFQTRESRVVVMLNLICLAFSDKNFHINETVFLKDLTKSFGFSDDEYQNFVDRGQSQALLMSEANLMVSRAAR